MKKILWVEDNKGYVRGNLEELFGMNLSESDMDELRSMEGKDFSIKIKPFLRKRNIFIEEEFSKACAHIFKKGEADFDIIILDINFPVKPREKQKAIMETAKALFTEAFADEEEERPQIEEIFGEILANEDYTGLLLFYLICLHYERQKGCWKLPDVGESVCFFTGNEVGLDHFQSLLRERFSNGYSLREGWKIREYIQSVESNFWFKEDKNLIKVKAFIEKDPYLDTLEQHLGKTEKELFAKVLQTRDDETLIETNLSNLRKLQEKMLEKLANDVPPFQRMKNEYLRDGNINVRGSLRWLNDNPDSFYISQDAIRDWDTLFDVLKGHSNIISKRIYDFLDYRSQRRVSDWTNDRDTEALKRFVVRDLNAIINRKDFFFCDLVPQEYWKDNEYGGIRRILNKGFFLSDFEYKKLNRFLIDRVLSQTIRKRETYFDDMHYHLALSIHAIGSEAAHGAVIKQKEVLFSMIYAMKHIILRFGSFVDKALGGVKQMKILYVEDRLEENIFKYSETSFVWRCKHET
ncbi:hypothetical protein QUF72_01500 [Desulfobacterales bacterium HSG2]|nr:hypothetical protein [Desulfobacterales bacterium HSG2]